MKRNSNHSASGSKENIFSRFFTKLRTSMDNQNSIIVNIQEKTSTSDMKENSNYKLDISSNNLPIFCDQLNNFIVNIEEILNQIYAENREGHLRKILEKNVNDLTQIRNEIKSTTENINMLNKYIVAVKKDTDEFRKYLKRLTNEERRAKLVLKREKMNQANLRRTNIPMPDTTSLSQTANNGLYYPQPMIGPQMLNSSTTNNTGTTLQFTDDVIVKQTRIFNRSSTVTKRNKNNRFRKDLTISDNNNSNNNTNNNNISSTENGVTLYLRPIQDIPEVNSIIIDTNEDEDNATSALNLSWFSNGTNMNNNNNNTNINNNNNNNNISITGSNNTSILEETPRRSGRQTETTHSSSAPNSIFTINSETYEEVD